MGNTPTFSHTSPPAILDKMVHDFASNPAAIPSDAMEITVSPAPETSKTCLILWAGK